MEGFNWKPVSFQPLISMAQTDKESVQTLVMKTINTLATSKVSISLEVTFLGNRRNGESHIG